MMNIQLELRGPGISLLPLTKSDLNDLFFAASDPLIWEQHPNSDRYKREPFELFFQKAIDSKGAFKVIDNQTSKIIGSSRYYEFDQKNRSVMVGYTFLQRAYWGGKINQEMKNLMLNHAFEFVEVVFFQIGEVNIRSQKALEKIGGKLIKKIILDQHPYRVYGIHKSEF